MNALHFRRLFEYDLWANREVLSALQRCQNPPAKTLQLLSHILAAEKIWHTRLRREDSSVLPVWPDHPLKECESLMTEVYQNWLTFLEGLSLERLAEKIHYKNSKGTPFETAAGDILMHVVIHGEHHRGQITTLLRQAGEQPPVTDFIAFVRNS